MIFQMWMEPIPCPTQERLVCGAMASQYESDTIGNMEYNGIPLWLRPEIQYHLNRRLPGQCSGRLFLTWAKRFT